MCIGIICCIFFMSSDSYSDVRTLNFSAIVYNHMPTKVQQVFIAKGIDTKTIDLVLRKSAHFFEYMLLSIVLLTISTIYKIKLKASIIYILFICLLVANLDEFYQGFVAGRHSAVIDCLIDFAGSVFGVLIYAFFIKIRNIKYGKKR